MSTDRTIPLHEEVLDVGKRVREGDTVRVETKVREEERTVAQDLASTDVEIERVPVGRVVDAPPGTRREGDVLILPVLEEELVVTKRLVLKEEIRITPRTRHRTEQATATVRVEDAVVTRDGASPSQSETGQSETGTRPGTQRRSDP